MLTCNFIPDFSNQFSFPLEIRENGILLKKEMSRICSGIPRQRLFIHCFQNDCCVLQRQKKTGEHGGKPSEQGREPTTNSTHIWFQLGPDSNQDRIGNGGGGGGGAGECSHHVSSLLPTRTHAMYATRDHGAPSLNGA